MPPPEENSNKKKPPVIRTMRTDAELYAKEKKLSTLQISASAYAAQTKFPVSNENKKSPNKIILFSGGILLFAIILVVSIWWFLSSKDSSPKIPEIPPPVAIIFVDGQNTLIVKQANKESIVNAFSAELVKTFRSGIINYYPVKINLEDKNALYFKIKDFSKILEWNMPQILLDNLFPDFNAYIFVNKQSNDFAMVLRTTNFEKAFLSMLEWEKTLARDWKDFLNNANSMVVFPNAFKDEIIKNHDARILTKDDGSVIIGYVIFNKKYIIISTSREALGAILDRLIMLPPR